MDHFKLKNLTTVASEILSNKLVKDGIVGQPLLIQTGKDVDFVQTYGIGMNSMMCRPIHPGAVSYTHLDVYKRQIQENILCRCRGGRRL